MDFGRPLLEKEGIISRSNIHLLPESDNTCTALSLDERLIRAANRSAVHICQHTHEHELPVSSTIQPNDLVVVLESFDNLNFVYAQRGATFSNRNGVFSHDDILGQPWGCKVRSASHSGFGFLYLLKPTPELWARSLPHRTQIIHELDSSMIVFQLGLKPNMTVVESGTGSGALSHAALRTLAPRGHLHTFEFHEARANRAREEFQNHNLSHLVTVHHADVCQQGFFLDVVGQAQDDDVQQQQLQKVDAVVLDLPEPWLAIPRAPIKCGGRIACYSPCVEQVQRTIQALTCCGFHSIKTMEYRLREYYVDPVYYEPPPADKRPGRQDNSNNATTTAAQEQTQENDNDVQKVADEKPELLSSEREAKEENEPAKEEDVPLAGKKRKRALCARPFATMKGHSAFLTFATAGNGPRKQSEM
jgi:tRNA (adenine57-N1/adenine58-N1)-methyltransferase